MEVEQEKAPSIVRSNNGILIDIFLFSLISCYTGSNNIISPIFLTTYLGVIPDRSLLVLTFPLL
jgi:hypothetical protein